MRLFLDTNILYLVLRPPRDAPALLAWLDERKERLATGQDDAVISPLVLDELAYRLVLALLKDAGQRDPLGALRADPAEVMRQQRRRIAPLLEDIAALPGLTIAPVTAQTFASALRVLMRFALLPRDACHVAVAEATGCQALVSLDPNFARSAELVAWIGPPSQ